MEMGKQKSRTFPGLIQDFSFFKDSISSQFCITQRLKVHLFQPEAEYELQLALWRESSDFHSVFLRFSHSFFAHPINLKGLVVFYIFQRLIHIFKDDFTQFQDNSRTKGTFFQDQGQIFPGLCEPCKSISHIICHINPKSNLWIYVVVMECRSLFSSTVTLISGVSSWKRRPQQIAYFIYGSIPYLVCR